MKYKALMLDVDGTIIPYKFDAVPSARVKNAIQQAVQKGVHVCLVTGRSYPSVKRLLDSLEIKNGYTVVDGGSVIYNVASGKIIHAQYLESQDVQKIITVFEQEDIPFYVKNKESIYLRDQDGYLIYQKGNSLSDVSMIFTKEIFTIERINQLSKMLISPTLTVIRSRHSDPNKFSFNLTHLKATKLHGIEQLQEILNLKREEIIGAGDGYNDFPLLMASGLKVAMGNAIDDLKEIADYVAPTVEEDGVADIIEKFVTMD